MGLYSVCLAEFHQTKGNTISYTFPAGNDPTERYKNKNLADICFPDGSHLIKEDKTYVLLDFEGQVLYGIVCFQQKEDKSLKRGALQKSILLLSFKPYFPCFEPLIHAALTKLLEFSTDQPEETNKIIGELYRALSEKASSDDTVSFLDEIYTIPVPRLVGDQIPGISLSELIKIFGVETMIFWRAILLEKRVLFSGTPAKDVANLCLACPYLIAPLRGLVKNLYPYVSLTDITPVTIKGSVCGTTNKLFETKPNEWFDYCGSLSQRKVLMTIPWKVEGSDLQLIETVLDGIFRNGKDDEWAQEQFRQHTQNFLLEVNFGKFFSDTHKDMSADFKKTALYENFLNDCRADIIYLFEKLQPLKFLKTQKKQVNSLIDEPTISAFQENLKQLDIQTYENDLEKEDIAKYKTLQMWLQEPSDEWIQQNTVKKKKKNLFEKLGDSAKRRATTIFHDKKPSSKNLKDKKEVKGKDGLTSPRGVIEGKGPVNTPTSEEVKDVIQSFEAEDDSIVPDMPLPILTEDVIVDMDLYTRRENMQLSLYKDRDKIYANITPIPENPIRYTVGGTNKNNMAAEKLPPKSDKLPTVPASSTPSKR